MNKETLIYSRAAASRILNCKPEEIKRVEVWPQVVFVVNGRGKFISKKDFLVEFARFRKEGSVSLKVKKVSLGVFLVQSSRRPEEYYKVVQGAQRFGCTCADFRSQVQAGIKNATCKHIYAVLRVLGYSSLRDYQLQK